MPRWGTTEYKPRITASPERQAEVRKAIDRLHTVREAAANDDNMTDEEYAAISLRIATEIDALTDSLYETREQVANRTRRNRHDEADRH